MLEIEPFNAMALILHHAPGTCALLLGSGLSRSAGIATGWEITLDLVRRLAQLEGATAGDDPAQWYRDRHGKDPNVTSRCPH
jgi:hypothetical protein